MSWAQLLGTDQQPSVGGRSHYVRDYDKIVFSQPFRLLHNKTQVLPLPADDFVHSRLTHSLEVSSVGRSLGQLVGQGLLQREGRQLGEDLPEKLAEVVRAACLAHDIGNPPFGHAGEAAICEFFSALFSRYHPWQGEGMTPQVGGIPPPPFCDFVSFEGNAQGFRLISGTGNVAAGMLSPLSRLAFSKYTRGVPPPRYHQADSALRCDQQKVGFYHSECTAFGQLAVESGLLPLAPDGEAFVRHPLAWLVEAADDICYRVLDVEDGINLRYVGQREGCELLAKLAGVSYADQPLTALRSQAIKNLIEGVVTAFLNHSDEMLGGKLRLSLLALLPADLEATLAELRDLSGLRLYRHPKVLETLIVGCRLLKRLLANLVEAVCIHRESTDAKRVRQLLVSVARMSPSDWHRFDDEGTPYQRLRFLTDFVASLSDRGVVALVRKLEGSVLF